MAQAPAGAQETMTTSGTTDGLLATEGAYGAGDEPGDRTRSEAADRGGRAAGSPEPAGRGAGRLALALVLVPFAVSAVALLAGTGRSYISVADQALIEMHTRDIGSHTPLVGLYSRGEWSHPGPLLFFVLAPFYWLTGGHAIGLSLGALAINGASVAGMAAIARRRGGTALLLLTLLGSALLMRTLGADFVHDPWNCFVTTLPYGLLIFLVWSLWAGEAWALPVSLGVATFLAQTHVGFVLLAGPLVAWGVVGLVVAARRERDVRRLVRPGLITVGVLGLLWLPPVLDIVRSRPSNLRIIAQWFTRDGGDPHTLAEGWRVMSAQYTAVPEWLTTKHAFTLSGESPYLLSAPLPWLLVAVGVAGVVLWRIGRWSERTYVATLAVAFVVGVVAVARTVGAVFDYRLRWTFVVGMLGLVAVAWLGWQLATRRWPGAERRVLVPLAVVALGAVTVVNTVTAATAGSPHTGESEVMRTILPQVEAALPPTDGQVLVDDAFQSGAWYGRSLILELERRGYDVRVPQARGAVYGEQRVIDEPEMSLRLVIAMDDAVDVIDDNPTVRGIARWEAVPAQRRADLLAERDDLIEGMNAHDVGAVEGTRRLDRINDELAGDTDAVGYQVAVYLDLGVGDGRPAG
jgi:hypothetical protein